MNNELLLCTDLDRTLIPNGTQPESPEARVLFNNIVVRPEVTLVYVTGRHKELIQEAIDEFGLPIPDIAVADVGTIIYDIVKTSWKRRIDWDKKISSDWNEKKQPDLVSLFHDIGKCRLQEAARQNEHKLSYYVDVSTNIESLRGKIRFRLNQSDIRANIIWSIDRATNIGLLDILPKSANKRSAIEYLMQIHGFSLENTVFAGDSGNDLDVLTSPIKSILVGNADADLKELARKEVAIKNLKNSLYISQGSLGLNGDYSAGIIEGLVHYFPELKYI